MKKTIKAAKGMMSGKDSIAGIRKGNKSMGKAPRTEKASGGLCSGDWMASQGDGSKPKR